MHELAMTESLIQLIRSEAEEKGFSRVLEIRLKIGEYSGVIPECIHEFFPIAARDSIAREAKLLIEPVPAAFLCRDCGYEGAVQRGNACCPVCGGYNIKMTAGREFFVDSLKVE